MLMPLMVAFVMPTASGGAAGRTSAGWGATSRIGWRRRRPGKTQLLPGGSRRGQQGQAPPGVSLIDEQAAKGLQRFDQPQVVADFELPGQRLMAAVDRRGPIAP